MPARGPGATATAPRVGVVTVSYGSGEALRTFLESLRTHHGDEMPVAVVDNKPDIENVHDLAEEFGAAYVPLPRNPGYGAGMNAGVDALRAAQTNPGETFDAFFFCNPDVRFLAPAIAPLAATLLADPLAGSIGPRLLNDDGSVYPSARHIPSVGTGAGHALLGRVWPTNPWSRAYTDAANYEEPRPAGWLSGAAVMVRADVYDRVNGWDEAYFMHFEDVDLGWRIGRAGFTNLYEPGVSVEHTGAHSTTKHAVAAERAMTDSAIRFMRKRYSGALHAPLRVAITMGLRVRGTLRVWGARRHSSRRQALETNRDTESRMRRRRRVT